MVVDCDLKINFGSGANDNFFYFGRGGYLKFLNWMFPCIYTVFFCDIFSGPSTEWGVPP